MRTTVTRYSTIPRARLSRGGLHRGAEIADVPVETPLPEIGQRLRSLQKNSTLDPQLKGAAVHAHSRRMIQAVFRQPTAESIAETKEAISHIVEIVLSDDDTARCLLTMLEHDHCTYTHSINVGVYAISLVKRLYSGSQQHNLAELGAAFFLHDLGKTRIDPFILNKPGKLDAHESALIQAHPLHTDAILRETGHATEECRIIGLQHHERWDGDGYPMRLKGDEIHTYARICSIADVFESLTGMRPYRRPLTAFQALNLMRDQMLGHFHEDLLHAFIMLFAPKGVR